MKKDKPKITVGDYEVVRRGSRIAVQTPGYWDHYASYDIGIGYTGKQVPPALEVSFDRKTARQLLRLPKQLLAEKAQHSTIDKRIARLQARINALESKKLTLGKRVVRGYKVYPYQDGLIFGCSTVTKESLDAIKKLLDK